MVKEDNKIKVVDIENLKQDDKNFNRGTKRGRKLISKSIKQFGAGRSVLLDKNNRIIAGNKTQELAKEAGIKKVIVIDAKQNELVAVRRSDVDLDSAAGREMALADNATGAANLDWDDEALSRAQEEIGLSVEDWGDFFDDKNIFGNAYTIRGISGLKFKVTYHRRGSRGFFTLYNAVKSKDSKMSLKSIKEKGNVALFSSTTVSFIRELIGMRITKGWALVCAPKRRTTENNFAELTCIEISNELGLHFYKDAIKSHGKDRISPNFTLETEIEEENIILYDDIVTTCCTIGAMLNLFEGKNTLTIVGIHNH